MSVQDSQARREFSYAELCEEARKRSAEIAAEEAANAEKRKGLEFMALRFNVVDKRRQLQREKKISPAESCLLQEIELGTIGARNKKKAIGSMAEFYLEDLSNNLGYKNTNKIWVLLKSLQSKGLILRAPTRSKGLESIGLNPEVFGQILIDKEHAKEKKRLLRLVHNSESRVDNPKETTHESGPDHTRIESDQHTNRVNQHTNRVLTDIQHTENIDEKIPLDSFRLNLDSFRLRENGSQETHVSQDKKPGTGTSTKGEMTPEEIEAEKKRQLSMAIKAGIL